jgi:hypothetical protein
MTSLVYRQPENATASGVVLVVILLIAVIFVAKREKASFSRV